MLPHPQRMAVWPRSQTHKLSLQTPTIQTTVMTPQQRNVWTASLCCLEVAHRSISAPSETNPATGSKWQNIRSSRFTAIALPIMLPAYRTDTMLKFSCAGLIAKRRSISARVMRRPRVDSQWPPEVKRAFVKRGLLLSMKLTWQEIGAFIAQAATAVMAIPYQGTTLTCASVKPRAF